MNIKMTNIDEVPNEILEYILYNVEQDTLRSQCTNVSTKWKHIIQSVEFWIRYHHFWCTKKHQIPWWPVIDSDKSQSTECNAQVYDWNFYSHLNPMNNPFKRNLLKNHSGSLISAEELHSQENRYYEGKCANVSVLVIKILAGLINNYFDLILIDNRIIHIFLIRWLH